MRFALSTNWNGAAHADGAAISDEALALGFDALELGFRLLPTQLPGIRSRLDAMPVDSVHAYCPVPAGAPSGHPELHNLLSDDANERAWARLLLRQTFDCAADLGAKCVVFHAGYVDLVTFFSSHGAHALKAALAAAGGDRQAPRYVRRVARAQKLRHARGQKIYARFRREFERLSGELEKRALVLALENLPRIEGFPDAQEGERLMADFAGAPLRLWLDTGHARVCAMHGWGETEAALARRLRTHIAGIHLNDVKDFSDDHRQPGWGGVDFAALAPLAAGDVLRVFEPHQPVSADDLRTSLAYVRALWGAAGDAYDG